jgi:hypothetical protein
MSRKWWNGLSDLERNQHRVKISRGLFDSTVRSLSYVQADWAREMLAKLEAQRPVLEPAEIKVGLRRLNS